jgi:hypothetical protein
MYASEIINDTPVGSSTVNYVTFISPVLSHLKPSNALVDSNWANHGQCPGFFVIV